ncbi:MAG: hypothetical protein OEX97_00275 [Acidimicrobiia bacterium]|nr:hypothetical protein [Acidimicrobiia bacterium]
MINRRARARLLLIAIALLALSNVAAICFGSGAWKVFTHEDGFIVIDSTGALFGTTDDGDTWEPTRSLPRERTHYSDEVCLDSGECYRIRSDRLGIEVGQGESWVTSWEYPSGRASYLGRQLPGPCGDGHAELGLANMAPTYAGSRWQLVVAAGADGVLGLDRDGSWVRDVYTPPAREDAGLADVYLVPELLTTALVLVGIAVVFGFHDRSEVARATAGAFVAWAGAVGVWIFAQNLGVRSAFVLFLLALVPLIGLGFWCAGRYCDLAEIMVGCFLGAGVAVGGVAVEMSHGDFSFGIVLTVIAAIVLGAGGIAARDQIGKWPLTLLDWLVLVVTLVVGALLALAVYPLWVWGWIGPRLWADGLVVLIAFATVWVARRIWIGRGNLENIRPVT